jgi:hypothetical protein
VACRRREDGVVLVGELDWLMGGACGLLCMYILGRLGLCRLPALFSPIIKRLIVISWRVRSWLDCT